MKKTPLYLFFALLACACSRKITLAPNPVVPSEGQLRYQEQELIGFIHFTINTFTDKEWGFGDESPALFNPSQLDVEQWVSVAKEAGLKQLILTAKHHDGFCLWPSSYTEHSIKKSPYKNGQGDIVKEFTEACKKYNIKAGLYLSPWDRNHAAYGTPEYITYYRNQLTELLTNYGPIAEFWVDGANGGTGYYGGANEERVIDRKTYYDWDSTFYLAKKLQPDILIFSDAGPDIHWIGNEKGFAGETFWSMMDLNRVYIGTPETDYLNTGDPNGTSWVVGECDVSIRPGWFYHKNQDSLVKTPQQLVDIYYKSVGRNGVLLLNIPPDQRGLFHEIDVKNLKEFRSILDETFSTNLAEGAEASVSTGVGANLILDKNPSTFWAAKQNDRNADIIIELNKPTSFDRILLQEPIRYGQRVSKFNIQGEVNGNWQDIISGTTIGYKKLLRIDPITISKIKIQILEANNTPALSNFGLYKASNRE
ncbi:MAG: alpha-L-fucosidase [Saprospiraceae bacterium]|nr:alpha-L-fucosidase [Saprospiraceae bacterium]